MHIVQEMRTFVMFCHDEIMERLITQKAWPTNQAHGSGEGAKPNPNNLKDKLERDLSQSFVLNDPKKDFAADP